MTNTPASTMEWKESGNDTTGPIHTVRCLPYRVGSILPGDTHGRPVVHKGKVTPYQLPRVASSDAGSQNIPEESGKQTHPVVTRQHNSSCVYKLSGQDSLCPGNETCQRAMDVILLLLLLILYNSKAGMTHVYSMNIHKTQTK